MKKFTKRHKGGRRGVRWLSLVCFAWLIAQVQPTLAAPIATFTVTKTADTNDGVCDADCSLREAIVAANANPGADTINFGVHGMFLLSLTGAGEDAAASGDLDITGDLTLQGISPSLTIIDGNMTDRVFDVRPATGTTLHVTLANLTIQHGSLASGIGNNGAGINDPGSTSGISMMTLTQVTVSNNTTGNNGGGISISRNFAAIGDPAVTLINSTVSGNSGLNGGGFQCITCDITAEGSTIAGNMATGDGGGIYTTGNNSTIVLNRSTLSGNQANDDGGGLAQPLGTGTVTLNFSTVTANVADNDSSSAGNGGGLYTVSGLVTLQNSIVQGNTDNSTPAAHDCNGPATSNGYNVVGAGTGCPSGGANDSTGDALLGGLQNNGGPTLTHMPAVGSAASERVTDGTSGCTGGVSVDQRGAVRADGLNRGGSACDSGAVEGDSSQQPLAVGLRSVVSRDGWQSRLWLIGGLTAAGALSMLVSRRRTQRHW